MKNEQALTEKWAGRRIGAYLADIALLCAALVPMGIFIQGILGIEAKAGWQIWINILWNFSLPTWLYFIWSEQKRNGQTVGKRLLGLQVINQDGTPLTWQKSLMRTAIRLTPWELTHIAAFAISTNLVQFSLVQIAGVVIAMGLTAVYISIIVKTNGAKSIHDIFVATEVRSLPE